MAAQETSTAGRIILDVASDRLAVRIRPAGTAVVEELTAQDVLSELAAAKIRIDERATARAAEFVALARAGSVPTEGFLVAEGRPVVEPADEQFVWDEAFQQAAAEWQDDAPINYYKANSIVTIDQGGVLGTITPATQGQPGVDVYGNSLAPRHQPRQIEVSNGVARSDKDHNLLVAKVPGRVVFKRNVITVDETLDIRGDVDFQTGSVNSSVDVNIKGTVRDQFEVKCEKSITVGGAIEAARVEAANDVTVRGGILGQGRGCVQAGGEVVTKFCEEAVLRAAGNISVCKEVMNSSIHTDGRFLAARGAVIGGTLYARQGAEIETAGNANSVPTRIAVGLHPNVLSRIKGIEQEMQGKKAAAAKIRQTVEPLLANQKRLAPAQKETATELLYKAHAIEESIDQQRKAADEMLARARPEGTPAVSVAKMIYEGVIIRIGRRQSLFQKELKGPVRVEERKVKNVTEIVAVNELSGSVTILSSCICEEPWPDDDADAQGGEQPHGSGG